MRRQRDHPRRLTEGGLHARWRTVKELGNEIAVGADHRYHFSWPAAWLRPSAACLRLYLRGGSRELGACHKKRNASGGNDCRLHATESWADEAQTQKYLAL